MVLEKKTNTKQRDGRTDWQTGGRAPDKKWSCIKITWAFSADELTNTTTQALLKKKNILKQMSKTCIKNNIFYKENIRYWISYWILNYTFNKHGKFDFPQAQIVIINCTFMWICKFSHRDIFLNSLFIKRSSADKKLWLTDGRTDFCLQNTPNFPFMNFCCSFLALLFFKINFKEGKL